MNRMVRSACSSTLFVSVFCLAAVTACRDSVNSLLLEVADSTGSVAISPPSLHMNVGDKLMLVVTVDASSVQANHAFTWRTGNAAVATVDQNGLLTAIGGGTTSIIATSIANSAVKAAAAITVGSILPGLSISAINQDGKTADLSNISGRIDVVIVVPAYPPSYSTFDLLINCGGADTVVATQALAATMSAEQSITLSFNTAAFKNGLCILKARATTTAGTIVASAATPITLNNPTTASATLLGTDYLCNSRLQRVQLLSQSLIPFHRVATNALVDTRSHAGEIGNLRLKTGTPIPYALVGSE